MSKLFTPADIQYHHIVNDVLKNGAYSLDRTGTGCLKRFGKTMRFDSTQLPLITTKQVFWKSALGELLWIYQDQSNDVNLLKEKYGVKVWNEWAGEDGTIGKAYGYQVKKHNQIDRLIDGLKNNPQSRRHRIQLWSEEDAPEMNLEPCAFMTLWDVEDNKLNMQLVQRSADLGLGVPFNMIQYGLLHRMIAQVTELDLGAFKYDLTNAHVYVNHINPLRRQMERTGYLQPNIWINPEVKDFYDFTVNDIKIDGYKYQDFIPMEVSV
jgi:thymidylate synthase